MSNPAIDRAAVAIYEASRDADPLPLSECGRFAKVAIEAMRGIPDLCYDNYRCDKMWRELNSTEVLNLWIDAALKEG